MDADISGQGMPSNKYGKKWNEEFFFTAQQPENHKQYIGQEDERICKSQESRGPEWRGTDITGKEWQHQENGEYQVGDYYDPTQEFLQNRKFELRLLS